MDESLRRECRSQVRALGDGLLALEGDEGPADGVDDLFRTAHSLKGNLGMAGIDDGARLAHAVEDVLGAVRADRVDPTDASALVDEALSAVDAVEAALDARAADADAATEVDPDALVDRLRETLDARADPPSRDADGTDDDATGDPGRPETGPPAGDPDLTVEEALDRASEFDDLDAVVGRMEDDASEFEGISGGGTFDELTDDESTAAGTSTDGDSLGGATNEGTETFAEVKAEVDDDADLDDLDRELADVEFGEFDDDDDLTIRELVENDSVGEAVSGDVGAASEDPADRPEIELSSVEEVESEAEATGTTGTTEAEDAGPAFDFTDPEDLADPTGADPDDPEPAVAGGDDPVAGADPGGEPERDPATESGVGADVDDETEVDPTPGEPAVDAEPAPGEEADSGPGPAVEVEDDGVAEEPAVEVEDDEAPEEPSVETGVGPEPTGEPEPEPTVDADADVEEPAVDADPEAEEPAVDADADLEEPTVDADPEAEDPAVDAEPGPDDGAGPGTDDGEVPDIDDLVEEGLGVDAAGPSSADDPDVEGLAADVDATVDDEGTGVAADLPDVGPGDDDAEAPAFLRDRSVEEFESRFGGRFDDEEGEDATPEVLPANTIAESTLDAAAFRPERPTGPERPAASADTESIQSITVDARNADTLLNLVEELSVARLQVDRAVGEDPDDEVEEGLSALSRVTSEFRRTVMDLRLMPIERAVEGLPRVVRDVARAREKEVTFETDGTDVRLDRSIIDRVGEPLVHAVRNAVDHGIEPPGEREAAGKPREGTVRVSAERTRERVVVEVTDDGRGLDHDEILDAAVETGVVDASTAQSLPREEVFDLLFEPGFTTSAEVTDVSGRGVGMDVVDRVVSDLGGDVAVESTPGEGTTLRLTLPVTVAVDELLFVAVGDERFGVPVSVVEQVTDRATRVDVDGETRVRPPAGAGTGAGSGDAGTGPRSGVDGVEGVGDPVAGAGPDGGEPDGDAAAREPVPLVDLAAELDVPGGTVPDGPVVWVAHDGGAFALQCDRVVGTEESVVKPYEGILGGVSGVSGATRLGDGDLVNVIDVVSL